jgi:glycolate oxidase FAD binding subunit
MAAPVEPATFEEAAGVLREAAQAGRSVRILGGGSKPWGWNGSEPDLAIASTGLAQILEHNAGDLTAVLEAGVPLARAQQEFAGAGQMLALDPFLGLRHEATVGGILATADSGPLRHRYGAPRDLVLGMTVALSDGTVARSGGKVIKNVAGYDIGKLFCGSFGTLGMILSVSLRLHPLPAHTVTALGITDDADVACEAARVLAAAPLELEALDMAWRDGRGGILARCGGVQAPARAQRVAALMREARLGSIELATPDVELWARQRAGQRSRTSALLRVAVRPSATAAVLRASDACGGTVVTRAALGHCYVELDPAAVEALRERLPPEAHSVLLDAPEALRSSLDAWGRRPPAATLELMRRIKTRFDPAGICNPSAFVGMI